MTWASPSSRVRQAYELLSREGLIRSQRGVGTHVAALPAAVGDIELAINDLFAAPQALAFEILEVRRRTPVPQELLGPEDRPADENVCVRKLHTYSGEPFCYAEIYMPTAVFESLPRDIARKSKLLAAVLDELGPRCKRVRQRMTVMPADFPSVRHAEDSVRLARRQDVAAPGRRQGQRAVRRASPGTGATATSPRSTSPSPP